MTHTNSIIISDRNHLILTEAVRAMQERHAQELRQAETGHKQELVGVTSSS